MTTLSCSAVHLSEESGLVVLISSSRALGGSYKIPLKLSLQAQSAQLLQPLFTGQAQQAPHHFHGPVLKLLQFIHLSFTGGSQTEHSIPGAF